MEDKDREQILSEIKRAFKNKDAKDGKYPDYVYDRILDMCAAHDIKPACTMIEVLSFNSREGGKTFTPMLTIGAIRSIAARAGAAGNDSIVWSKNKVKMVIQKQEMEVPEWGQMTVYRMVQGQRCPFISPKLYAKETVRDMPMWKTKLRFMFEKNIEAAAWRRACPEALSDIYIPEENFEEPPVDNGALDTLNNVKAEPKTKEPEEKLSSAGKVLTLGEAKVMHKKLKEAPEDKEESVPQEPDEPDEKPIIPPDQVDIWVETIRECKTMADLADAANTLNSMFTLTPEARKVLNDERKKRLAQIKGQA